MMDSFAPRSFEVLVFRHSIGYLEHLWTQVFCRCLPSIHTNSRKDLCKLPHLRDKDEATKGRTNVVAVYLVNVAEVEHVRPPHLTEQFGWYAACLPIFVTVFPC